MLGQYLIAFREGFEAALICSILLAYLARTGRPHLSRYVYYGIVVAVTAGVLTGVSLLALYGSISEPSKVLFEGVSAVVAVMVLTWMIYWMAYKGKRVQHHLERKIETLASGKTIMQALGISLLTFIVVFREGLETVLFLTPFMVVDPGPTLAGMGLGLISAVALSYAISFAGMKIDIQNFFYYTSILLVLLAGGLLGYAAHELLEYGEISGMDAGWFGMAAYDLHLPEGSVWHHKGLVGSIFAVMFGYSVRAEWLRVVLHAAYLFIMFPLMIWIYRREAFLRFVRSIRAHLPFRGGGGV